MFSVNLEFLVCDCVCIRLSVLHQPFLLGCRVSYLGISLVKLHSSCVTASLLQEREVQRPNTKQRLSG